MKPHPRIRKTVKWGGMTLTVLLMTAWMVGALCMVWFARIGINVMVDSGTITFLPSGGGHAFGQWVVWEPHAPQLRWWFEWVDAGYARLLIVPLWVPSSLILACTATAWRLDGLARRRFRLGYCACGYDRCGLAPADAVCPECGSPAPQQSKPAAAWGSAAPE